MTVHSYVTPLSRPRQVSALSGQTETPGQRGARLGGRQSAVLRPTSRNAADRAHRLTSGSAVARPPPARRKRKPRPWSEADPRDCPRPRFPAQPYRRIRFRFRGKLPEARGRVREEAAGAARSCSDARQPRRRGAGVGAEPVGGSPGRSSQLTAPGSAGLPSAACSPAGGRAPAPLGVGRGTPRSGRPVRCPRRLRAD